MGKSLEEIAKDLKKNNKKVQLIYAFNGTGKTRLSREFKEVVVPKKHAEAADNDLASKQIIYYNAFTEDLFYWDNDLVNDIEPKLKIQKNSFTSWVFVDQGQDSNVIKNFQHYTDVKLTPHFNAEYTFKDKENQNKKVDAFSEVTFSYERGNDEPLGNDKNIKISKGEESCFIWSVFYSLLEQVIDVLNVPEVTERETNQFDHLEYIFIDDPVSSLDDNHLIELAVNLAQLIKNSKSDLKFIITTHNPLFYNVLHNEFKKATFILKKEEDGQYNLALQSTDAPFSYHLFLKSEIEKAIETGQVQKYHFNFFRNILEKTSTFLGYENWGEILPKTADGKTDPYESRIINISSHSKHSAEEIVELTENDKKVLSYMLKEIEKNHKFYNWEKVYDRL